MCKVRRGHSDHGAICRGKSGENPAQSRYGKRKICLEKLLKPECPPVDASQSPFARKGVMVLESPHGERRSDTHTILSGWFFYALSNTLLLS